MIFWTILNIALVSASIIGIDYGTDWYKVSLIKPGPVIETVLNRESKRKTAAVVLIRDGIRYFGSDAVALGTRYPLTNYPTLKYVVGKDYDDKEAFEYRQTWSNNMVKGLERGVVGFDNGNGTWSVEALIAMQFAHARKMAESYGGEKVNGAVITVPPYFGPFERQVILDAAELGGINVLALMNDETAVAMSFGIGKKDSDFQKPQYHLFYDMGAGSTVASLVKFSIVNVTSHGTIRPFLEMETIDFGYDSLLGGRSFDKIVQGLLIEKFKNGPGKGVDVEANTKAMAKFFKEANRVKQILSANTETFASIENVIDGIDFREKFTRKEFEERSKDLLDRVEGPVTSILKRSNLSIADVSSLVLVGGGIRIPAIQAVLSKLVGAEKIARNVDGDEAAVFGAVYHGASISAQFRTRRGIKVKDISSRPISVEYKSLDSTPVLMNIFPEKSKIGSKKLVNFGVSSDFTFKLLFADNQKTMALVEVSGLEEAKLQFKDKVINSLKVKAMLELSESGLISIPKVYAIFEIGKEAQGILDNVMDFFSSDEKKKETEGDENKPDDEIASDPTPKAKDEKSEKTDQKAKKSTMEQVALKVSIKWQNQIPLTSKEKEEIRSMLNLMDKEDKVRQLREEARNELESYIYKSKEITYDTSYEAFSTSKVREELKEALDKASEWMEDHDTDGSRQDFQSQHQVLRDLADPIFLRSREYNQRPLAISDYESILEKCKSALSEFQLADDDDTYFKKVYDKFEKLVSSNSDWYSETSKSQNSLTLVDNPVLLVKDLNSRRESLGESHDQIIKMIAAVKKEREKRQKASLTTSELSKETPDTDPKADSTMEPEPPVNANADNQDPDESHADL